MVGKHTLALRNAFLVCYCPVAASQHCRLSWNFWYCFYFVSWSLHMNYAIISFYWKYLHVWYGYLLMCVCLHICAHRCGGWRLTLGVSIHQFFSLCFGARSLTEPVIHQLRSAGWPVRFRLSQYWGCRHSSWALHWLSHLSLILLETIYLEFLFRAFIFVVYFIFMHISSCCTFTSICILISCLHGLFSPTFHWCHLSRGALKPPCQGSCSSMIPMGLSSWECLLWRQTAVPVSGLQATHHSTPLSVRFDSLELVLWISLRAYLVWPRSLLPMENVCWSIYISFWKCCTCPPTVTIWNQNVPKLITYVFFSAL